MLGSRASAAVAALIAPTECLDDPRLIGRAGDDLDVAASVHVQRRIGQQPAHDLGVGQRDDGIVGTSDDQRGCRMRGNAKMLVQPTPAINW